MDCHRRFVSNGVFAERILSIDLQMVAVCEESDHVRVSIKDTGIGIPKKELPLVFDEFYRAPNARKALNR